MTEQAWIFAAGLLAAIGAYFAKNFILDPLLRFREVKGRIQNRLRYHSNIITNGEFPSDIVMPITAELRQLSCDLEEKYYAISFATKLFWLYRIPSRKMLGVVASKLIFLSNSTGRNDRIEKNDEAINLIRDKLNITLAE